MRGKYKWNVVLDTAIDDYINSKHRKVGLKPRNVNEENETAIYADVYKNIKTFGRRQIFNINDIVRISKYKSVFDKGYTPNWSTELFKIVKVQITKPVTYLLENMSQRHFKGAFYTQELQTVKHSDIYLVDKVLRRDRKSVV